MADGKISFETGIDNRGLQKDLAKQKKIIEDSLKKIEKLDLKKTGLEESLESSEQKIKDFREAYASLEEQMRQKQELGYDTSEMQKELDKIDRSSEVAYEQSERIRQQIDQIVRETELEVQHITEAKDRAGDLATAMQDVAVASEETTTATEEVSEASSLIPEEEARAAQSAKELDDSTKSAAASTRELNGAAEETETRIRNASKEAGGLRDRMNSATESTSKTSNAMEALGRRIQNLAKRVFVFSVITKALRALRNAMSDAIGNNQEFQQSLADLKYAWRVAFQPIIEFVTPILIQLIQILTKVGQFIAAMFARFTGKSLSDLKKATQATKAYTKAVEKQAKAMRQLAGFDEMNVLQDDSASSYGGGDGGGASITPQFDVSQIEASLTELQLIASAAAIALGLILLCFGHIPLGIGLIILGVAGIADAVESDPEGVRNFIEENFGPLGEVLVTVGAIALGVGLLLLFFGQIPIGIALIILGVAALVVAEEADPEGVKKFIEDNFGSTDQLLTTVGFIAVAVGLLLLLFGRILIGVALLLVGIGAIIAAESDKPGAVSDFIEKNFGPVDKVLLGVGAIALAVGLVMLIFGHIPLGIALMLLGIGGVIAAASMDGDVSAFIEENKGHITGGIVIAGLFAVVLGILLLIAAQIPIGVALIILGATAIVSAAVMNKDVIIGFINENKETISTILLVGGAALVIIGAIVCFSGAALALGIGLIATGLGMLFAAAVLNWDTMSDEVRGTIATIATILSGASIVLGVILCLTGAGVGIGIALIIAGLAGTITAVSLEGNPLVDWVKGLINDIIGAVEWFINQILGGLNWLIDNINKIGFDVPDWVPLIGGKRFGFSLARIAEIQLPRLAEGAVIPANREFLAVLGDQKSGTNIETPLATMIEAFRTALNDYNGGDVTIPIYLDGKEIARHVIEINNQRQFALNGGLNV